MSWSIICADDVSPQRWKNNGGWTRELLAWPHLSDWLIRISVADIEADGPFSAFPGIDRWFAVLQGDGVRLLDQSLRPGDAPLAFMGELAPDCRLLGGMTRDFNLMHRRAHGRIHVSPADAALRPDARWVGLFTASGGELSHGGRTMPLRPMSLAWCETPALQTCEFEAAEPGSAWWMTWSDA